MCRRGSPQFRPAAGDLLETRLAAAKTGQPAGALALDECPQRLTHQGGLLGGASQALSLLQQVVIEGQRGAHLRSPDASSAASNDDLFYACPRLPALFRTAVSRRGRAWR